MFKQFIYSILLVIFPLIGLSQNFKNDFSYEKPEKFTKILFENIKDKKVDYIVFEFAATDSINLVKFNRFLELIKLEKLNIEYVDENASKKYPKAFILSTKDKKIYNEKTLSEQLNKLRKYAKKSKVLLSDVRYVFVDESPKIATNNNSIKNGRIKISGIISDGTEVLSYATIGIMGKDIGTISDKNGFFYYKYSNTKYQ